MGYFKPSTYAPDKQLRIQPGRQRRRHHAGRSLERVYRRPAGGFPRIHVHRKTFRLILRVATARPASLRALNLAAQNDGREPIALLGSMEQGAGLRELARERIRWRRRSIPPRGRPTAPDAEDPGQWPAGRSVRRTSSSTTPAERWVVVHHQVGTTRRIGTLSVYQDPADASYAVRACRGDSDAGVRQSAVRTVPRHGCEQCGDRRALLHERDRRQLRADTRPAFLGAAPVRGDREAQRRSARTRLHQRRGRSGADEAIHQAARGRRNGNTWTADAPSRTSAFSANTDITQATMSGDGKIIAIGSPLDTRPGLGRRSVRIRNPPGSSGTVAASGAPPAGGCADT